MKTKMIYVLSTLGFVATLFASVSFGEDGEACIGVDEAMADGNACLTICNQTFQACSRAVRKETKLNDCYECCKEHEKENVAPSNGSAFPVKNPPHDDLHAYMLRKCVVVPAAFRPNWIQGFPTDYPSAVAFDLTTGKIDAQVAAKYANKAPSVPGEIRSATESACMKGCTYRAQKPLHACAENYSVCRSRCPATVPTACGKR